VLNSPATTPRVRNFLVSIDSKELFPRSVRVRECDAAADAIPEILPLRNFGNQVGVNDSAIALRWRRTRVEVVSFI